MDLLIFYRALLPETGFFSLFSVPRKKHVWADGLEKLVEITERVNVEHSWYFATAAFKAKSRTQSETLGKKCFYLDIDCGADKHARDPDGTYETRDDGLRAVVAFAKATSLMPSLVVSSGAGLHVYYALAQEIGPQEWLPRAEALGALARANGLRVDAACTTDSARVLRPLGALHKNGNRVELLRDTGRRWELGAFDKLIGPVTTIVAPTRPTRRDVNSLLWEPTPYSAMKAAEYCMALRDIATQRGDVPEPEWRAMLGVVKFSTEGADLAHEWSAGYDDYSERETQRKLDKWEGTGPTLCATFAKFSERCGPCKYNGKISGPAQLGRLNESEVEKLPSDQKAADVPAPVPEELELPVPDLGIGYRVDKDERGNWRIEYMKAIDAEDPDGGKVKLKKWEVLSNDAFFVVDWTEAGIAEEEGAAAVIRLHRGKRVTHFEMPTSYLGQPALTRQFLSSKSITGADTTPEIQIKLWDYIHKQYNRSKMTLKPRPIIRENFGLQFESDDRDAELMCAFGKYVIRKDGTIHEAMLGERLRESSRLFSIPNLPEAIDGKWPASVWPEIIIPAARQQAAFLRRWYLDDEYRPAQLAFMLSIASPLMMFTAASKFVPGGLLPPLGLTVSLYSSSSAKGKSSVQKVCAATYGNETMHVKGGTAMDTTSNAQFGRAGMLGTMPFFADEITGNNAEEAAILINRIATGHEKDRMKSNGSLMKAHNWAFIGLVSTNIPQRELIANVQKTSDALQMRLIEIDCDGFADTEISNSTRHTEWDDDFRDNMSANAGALGAVLNLAILQAGQERITAVVAKCMRDAVVLIPGSSQRQRFMQRGMACVLAAEAIFRRVVGIETFSRDVLIEEYAKASQSATDFADAMHKPAFELLRTMISDYANQIIVTEDESHKKNDSRMDHIINKDSLRVPYVGRRVISSNKLYLMADAIKQWAADHQCSYNELLRAADKVGARLPVAMENGKQKMSYRVTLTKGTNLSTVWGTVYLFDEMILKEGLADSTDADNIVDMPQPATPRVFDASKLNQRPS